MSEFGAASERQPHQILEPGRERYVHLDLLRVLCILLVAIDRGAPDYAAHNALFCMGWVAQVLWLVAGISWSLNPRPWAVHVWRLGFYAGVGTCTNFVALVLSRGIIDFDNLFCNVWFILELAVCIAVTSSLKAVSNGHDPTAVRAFHPVGGQVTEDTEGCGGVKSGGADRNGAEETSIKGVLLLILVVCGCLAVHVSVGSVYGVLPPATEDDSTSSSGLWNAALFGQVLTCVGAYLIAMAGRWLLPSGFRPWLFWAITVHVYVCRLFLLTFLYGPSRVERFVTGPEWFLLGFTAATSGMRFARIIGKNLRRYWPVWIGFEALCYDPRDSIRLDLDPSASFFVASRVKISEIMFIGAFLGFGELLFDARIFTEDRATWLREWGVLLLLAHPAVHYLAPPIANWLLLAAALPLCWALRDHEPFRKALRGEWLMPDASQSMSLDNK